MVLITFKHQDDNVCHRSSGDLYTSSLEKQLFPNTIHLRRSVHAIIQPIWDIRETWYDSDDAKHPAYDDDYDDAAYNISCPRSRPEQQRPPECRAFFNGVEFIFDLS